MDLKEKINLLEKKVSTYEHIIEEFLPLQPEIQEFYLKTKAIKIPKTSYVYVATGGATWDDATNIDNVFDCYEKAKKYDKQYEDDKDYWTYCQKEKVK